MKSLGHNHTREERRWFIDASKVRLKGVVFHTGNEFPSVPVFNATQMKESKYKNSVAYSTTYTIAILQRFESHGSPCWHAAWFYQDLLLFM
jgi:hypothetical protein